MSLFRSSDGFLIPAGYRYVRRGDDHSAIDDLDVANEGSGGFGEVRAALPIPGAKPHLEIDVDDVAVDCVTGEGFAVGRPNEGAIVGVEVHDLLVHVADGLRHQARL